MKWYTEILRFAVIKQPVEILANDSLVGIAVIDIHSPKLMKMRMAWLNPANPVGLEIFEYIEAKAERLTTKFEHWKSGLCTFVLLIHMLKGCVKKISESGGRQRSKIWEVVTDKGIRIAFCEDPFGSHY